MSSQASSKRPKVACVNCARGKRNCSGTRPCERCTRLGKECNFPEEPKRRTRTKRFAGIQAELYPHVRGFAGPVFGAPQVTPFSLPPQLFPWQDIRLHMCARTQSDEANEYRGVGSVTTNHALQDPVFSGSDEPSYLKYLWDASLHTGVSASPIDSEDEGGGGDSEGGGGDDDEEEGGQYDYLSGVHSDEYSDEGEGGEHAHTHHSSHSHGGGGGSSVSSGMKRGRVEAHHHSHAPNGGAYGHSGGSSSGKRSRHGGFTEGFHAAEFGGGGGGSEPVDASTRVRTAIAQAKADSTPTWVAVYDTHTYELKQLFCNAASLSLFGWAQGEVDLRVHLKHVLRWLHPEDVLVRSVVAVNARKGTQPSYEFEGRYLRRKAMDLPASSLRKLYEGIQQLKSGGLDRTSSSSHPGGGGGGAGAAPQPSLSLARTSSATSNFATPSKVFLGADGLPASAPTFTKSASGSSVILRSSPTPTLQEEVTAALEELDDSMVYLVFSAREVVTNTYDEYDVTHIVTTRFVDVEVDESSATSGRQMTEELIRPQDFDISEAKPIHEDDVEFMMGVGGGGDRPRASPAYTLVESHSSPYGRGGVGAGGGVSLLPPTFPPSFSRHHQQHDPDTLTAAVVLAGALSSGAPSAVTDLRSNASSTAAPHDAMRVNGGGGSGSGGAQAFPARMGRGRGAGATRAGRGGATSGATSATSVSGGGSGVANSVGGGSSTSASGGATHLPPKIPGVSGMSPFGRPPSERSITANLILMREASDAGLQLHEAQGDPFNADAAATHTPWPHRLRSDVPLPMPQATGPLATDPSGMFHAFPTSIDRVGSGRLRTGDSVRSADMNIPLDEAMRKARGQGR